MSLLGNLTVDENINNETDSLGGGGFILESGLYTMKVKLAYLRKSPKGAMGLNLHLETEDGKELRQTIYITSGDAKGNKNFYENDKGEKNYLPGFNLANSLSLLTVGKDLPDLEDSIEEKTINLYSADAKAEVPTKVPVVMDLLNQEIIAGVQKQLLDKNEKGDDGQYYPTGETREANEIDKFFRVKDRMTVTEIRAGKAEAVFIDQWNDRWAGQVRDRTSKDAGKGKSGAPKTGGNASNNSKPKNSLFGN